jgi:hypothetical protein
MRNHVFRESGMINKIIFSYSNIMLTNYQSIKFQSPKICLWSTSNPSIHASKSIVNKFYQVFGKSLSKLMSNAVLDPIYKKKQQVLCRFLLKFSKKNLKEHSFYSLRFFGFIHSITPMFCFSCWHLESVN